VTVAQATPTTWRMLLPFVADELRGVRVLCGGGALPADLARELATRSERLWNVYGPTETTIWSTAATVGPDAVDPVPIGRPINRTSVHVLDADGRDVPDGTDGELCIGGAGLAEGISATRSRPPGRSSRIPCTAGSTAPATGSVAGPTGS
jgi:non-ribosomal peptide synthetase component F